MSARNRRLSQRGFSLAEIMTALAVFALIFVAALLLYDRANRVFTNSAQSAEMQQATRVAFDKILQDVRMSGFDYKRGGIPQTSFTTRAKSTAYVVGQMVLPDVANGHVYKCTTAGTSSSGAITWQTGTNSTTSDGSTLVWTEAGTITAAFDQPDEQIEYAWHSALTIRGNFNYETPDDAVHYEHGRESNLETAKFPVVTTGNDEIVTYVLHSDKPGAANSDSVQFYADVNSSAPASRTAYPGGNSERQITINSVDLSNANPPYTLYRVTLNDAGEIVRTPLADNIRSMTFDYFQDPQGNVPLKDADGDAITDVGGNGQFDPSTPASANHVDRLTRKNIRAIKVTLVGMNAASDNKYTDAADTIAPHFRKMTLATTISPRNLGIVPNIQSPLQPPPAPINVAVCYGYCGIPYVSWLPGDPSSYATGSTGAESFSIAYDDTVSGDYSSVLPAGTLTSFALDMTQLGPDIGTKTYYFKVGATNAAGTKFAAPVGPISIKNATKPNPPGSLTATGSGGVGAPQIKLAWRTPSGNASGAPSCTTGTTTVTTVAAEIRGYRVYRSTSTGFTPAAGNMIADVGATGTVADGAGGWSYTDATVGSCTPYYYKIQAVEWCTTAAQNTSGNATDSESGYSSEVTGTVTANRAATPTGLQVDTAVTSCAFATNQCNPVKIKWTKVITDTAAATINVDSYDIYRRVRYGTFTGAYAVVATLTGQTGATSPISYTEPSPLQDHENGSPFQQHYYDYYVVAKFGCGDSDISSVVTVPNNCDTGVTVASTNAASGAGSSASPWVAPANGSLTVKMLPGASPYTGITAGFVSLDGGAPTVLASPWTYNWSDSGDNTVHTLSFTATTTCTQSLPAVYIQASPAGCHLQTTTGDASMIAVPATIESGFAGEIDITVKNLSQDTLTISSIAITDVLPKNSGTWKYFELPGGTQTQTASPTNLPVTAASSGATTTIKTFSLSSAVATDKTVGPGASKVYKLLYTEVNGDKGGFAAGDITSVVVTMRTAAGGTTDFNCQIKQ